MISFVATFRTPTTFKGFSMLPLPAFITSAAPSPPIRRYEYFILFRSHGDQLMDGIAIGIIEENTDIVIEGSTHLTVLRNATEEIVILTNRDLKHTLTDLQPLEILWIKPETNHNCTPTPRILSGTKITSLKPLSVYTTEAMCNNIGGSSELVHQMPLLTNGG